MGLHIIVCIKAVMLEPSRGQPIRSLDSLELNPFDWPALEVALRMKEERGGTVTALSMGPEDGVFVLYEAMAMGVDRGVLVCDAALAGSDTLATSTALAAAIKKLSPFDLVLFGTRTADSDTGQVGPQTAVVLNLPMVTGVNSIQWTNSGIHVERYADGLREEFKLSLSAALSIHPRSVQPRGLGLFGIERAFEKGKVEKWDLAKLDLSPDRVGWAGSATRVLSLKRVTSERKCRFISGTADEQVEELVSHLKKWGFTG
jgi:electron transfer flavoprotein beta subunit